MIWSILILATPRNIDIISFVLIRSDTPVQGPRYRAPSNRTIEKLNPLMRGPASGSRGHVMYLVQFLA